MICGSEQSRLREDRRRRDDVRRRHCLNSRFCARCSRSSGHVSVRARGVGTALRSPPARKLSSSPLPSLHSNGSLSGSPFPLRSPPPPPPLPLRPRFARARNHIRERRRRRRQSPGGARPRTPPKEALSKELEFRLTTAENPQRNDGATRRCGG